MRCEGGVTGSRKRKKRKKKKEEPHTLWLGGLVPVSFLFFLLLFCSLRDNGVARRTYSPLQADGFAAFARLPAVTKYRNRADDLRALINYWLRPSEFIGSSDSAARRVLTELYTTGERRKKKKKRAMLWNTWRSGSRCFIFFPLPFTPPCVCSFRSYLFFLFLSFFLKKWQ